MPHYNKTIANKIHNAFGHLEAAVDRTNSEAQRCLYRALKAAEEGERRHRRGGPSGTTSVYLQSVATAARYFVLKWACQHDASELTSASAAAALREDALFAAAVREHLDKAGRWPFASNPVEGIDYTKDIVRS